MLAGRHGMSNARPRLSSACLPEIVNKPICRKWRVHSVIQQTFLVPGTVLGVRDTKISKTQLQPSNVLQS